MKKTIRLIFSLSMIIALISCASTKNGDIDNSQDSYESETIKTTEKNSKKTSFENPFASLFKFGNSGDFVVLDETNLYTKTVLGSVKQQNAETVIYTKDGKFGFGSNYMSVYYFLLMDTTSRNQIEAAYNSYLRDFETKKLSRKGSNRFKKYGKTKVDLRWGTLKASTPNYGTGDMYIGYEFVEKSPYFTLTIHPVYNYYSEVTDSVSRESIMLNYYFTKAQMRDLLDRISDEALTSYFKKDSNTEDDNY